MIFTDIAHPKFRNRSNPPIRQSTGMRGPNENEIGTTCPMLPASARRDSKTTVGYLWKHPRAAGMLFLISS